MGVERRDAGARVDEEEARVGRARPPPRSARACGRQALRRRLVEAGGVDRGEAEVAEPRLALAAVAGHAGQVVDQRQRWPTSRLNSVDLPTFGRPTMATRNGRRFAGIGSVFGGRVPARRAGRAASLRLRARPAAAASPARALIRRA